MAESILHYGGMTLRVNGIGNLRMRLIGLDDTTEFVALPLNMVAAAGIEPIRLMNFKAQRARYELKTTDINEIMNVNRIVVWAKELYTSHPGTI